MKDQALYNCQDQHGEIPAIYENSRDGAPEDELETPEIQIEARHLWKTGVHPKDLLCPPNWASTADSTRVERLANIVDFAFQKVPMYRDLYSSIGYKFGSIKTMADFEKLPIITRKILAGVDDGARLAKGHAPDTTYFVGTSGSSGKSLKVFYDAQAALVETYESLQQFSFFLGRPLPADRWIYNIHMSRGWLSSLQGEYRTFTLSAPVSPEDLSKHLDMLRPVILCCLPSHLEMLLELGDLRRFGVECVTTNSEQSSAVLRRRFADTFKVPVLDEYSSVELGLIAYECIGDGYHVNEDGLYVELVDQGEDEGRVVATDFRSWVMPLIRYDQGDLASWETSTTTCACGTPGARFSRISGRQDDYFLMINGGKVASATLLNLLDVIFTDGSSTLHEYRLRQTSLKEVTLDFVPMIGTQDVPTQTAIYLVERLKNLLGDEITVTFKRFEELPQSNNYKRKKIIREIK